MKIAIIGAGVSGMTLAYILRDHHDITLYEKNSYIGGHARTIKLYDKGRDISIDTGFMVFNENNYPNLIKLFKKLGVGFVNSDMSFGVSINEGWLEYSSNSWFKKIKNYFKPAYWLMLYEIIKFNKIAYKSVNIDENLRVCDFLDNIKVSSWFKNYYLLPMAASIWSSPLQKVLEMPANTLITFFRNHGLLSNYKRPTWRTVSGGSKEYIKKLTSSFKDNIKANTCIKNVTLEKSDITVIDDQGNREIFDHVVFACHGNEVMELLNNQEEKLKNVFKSFKYQKNKIIVHTDVNFMPLDKKCWASWNYIADVMVNQNSAVSVSYWINNLQNITYEVPIFITLNPSRRPKETDIIDEHIFSHPIMDIDSINAQKEIKTIQGQSNLWYCGAYLGYGFHEDGLVSAIKIAKAFGVNTKWT